MSCGVLLMQAGAGSADLLSAAHQIRTTLLSGDTQAVLDQQTHSAKALADSLIFRVRFNCAELVKVNYVDHERSSAAQECRGSLLLARQHLIELLRAGKDREALGVAP